ncbi:MAG: hypothetical protein R6X12_00400 [bacterium]
MSRIGLVALVLAAATAAGAVHPYLALRVCQPWDEDIQATYRALPELGFGVRSPRTDKVALDAGLSARLANGAGEFSDFRLWDATGRIAVEFVLNRTLGLAVAPGVLYKYAVERRPDHDSAHNIIQRDFGGSSIGFFARAGVTLFRFGEAHLNVETGMELVSVQTARRVDWGPFGWWGYQRLPLHSFDLGIVVGYGGARSDQE